MQEIGAPILRFASRVYAQIVRRDESQSAQLRFEEGADTATVGERSGSSESGEAVGSIENQ
jgi:hypothetical protein